MMGEETKSLILLQFTTNFEGLYSKFPEVYRELKNKIEQVYEKKPEEGKVLVEIISKTENEECQKALISQNLLLKIISIITDGTQPEDGENAELYFTLQRCCNNSTKLNFLDKNLEIIRANKTNALEPQKQFALNNLKKAQLPRTLEDRETDFYTTLTDSMNTVGQPEHKSEFIQVILRYCKLLSEDNMKNFIQSFLKPYIDTYDANLSKSVIEGMKGVDSPTLEEAWDALIPRSLGLLDDQLLELVFDHIRSDETKIKTFFKDLVDKDLNKAIATTQKFKESLPKQAANIIVEVLIDKSRSLSHNQLPPIFDLLVEIFGSATREYRDKFADRLYELIVDTSNPDNQNVGLVYIDRVIEKISKTKMEYVSQQLVKALPTVSPSTIFPPIFSIVEGTLKLQQYLPSDGKTDQIDFLLPLGVRSDLPPDIRKNGFEFLKRLSGLPHNRRSQVLEQLFNTLKTEPPFFEPCLNALLNFKKYKGRKGFWKEVREYLKKEYESGEEDLKPIAEKGLNTLKNI